MSKKIDLFASFKKEKAQQEKKMQAQGADTKAVRLKLGTTKRLIVSFLITALFFCICIAFLKNLTLEEETASVPVSVQEIPANTKVKAEDGYFALKEVPVSLIPEGALKNMAQAEGQFTVCHVGKNQILTSDLFCDREGAATDYENPLEVSVGTDAIDRIVGGVVREGDLVNISSVVSDYAAGTDGTSRYEYTYVPIATRAYVTRAFTAAGEVVESHDAEQPVTVINIIIPEEAEEAFNTALEEGTLRVSRVWN